MDALDAPRLAKLTIVIPAYSREGLGEMAAENLEAWDGQCDEIIVSEDWEYCEALAKIADFYILHSTLGTAESTNLAWKMAYERGADFVAIMDTDVRWHSGSLRDLCVRGQVSVPRCVQFPERISVAPMMVVPFGVALFSGYYNPAVGALKWFDQDFGSRVRQITKKVDSLEIDHIGGATVKRYASDLHQ